MKIEISNYGSIISDQNLGNKIYEEVNKIIQIHSKCIVDFLNVKSIIIFYIPNAFTPDGDEYNNVFKPVFESGYDPYDFHMAIYNRYGEMIFESYDVNGAWDGTYGTLELVQDGVYTWQIDFKEKYTDKRHSHSGHVTILR